MDGGQSKICSLHTYVMHHRMFYFERYCKTDDDAFRNNEASGK